MRSRLLPIIAISTLSAMLLVACGPTTVSQLTKEKSAQKLSAEEILQMAKGNTLFLQGNKTSSYFFFDESGNVFTKDLFNNKDTGRWDVSDEAELCFKMNDWWFGKLRCFPVLRDAGKYFLANNSGVLEFSGEITKGDSKSLYYTQKKSKKKFLMSQSREQNVSKPAPQVSSAGEPVTSYDSPSDGPSDEELQSTVKWMAKDCPGCNLAGSDLSGAELIGAKLHGADLSSSNLTKANLRRADLSEANLEGADLSYANLPGANLRGSDLTDTNFTGSNLIRADLTGANIEGARFDGALLEGIEGLQQ